MLNKLISYCADKYAKDGKCKTCGQQRCLCENNDEKTCYSCIKHIHKVATVDRDYDCRNLIYNYVIKQSYKHASEIAYAVEYLSKFKFVVDYPYWKVWSIGCGPCSEYFGLRYATEHTNGLRNKPISFVGFDLIESWNDIHDYIKNNIDPNIRIFNKDCFECSESPNLIILNYMLSDYCKRASSNINDFMSKLIDKIEKLPEVCVIINDISYRSFDNKCEYALDYMDDMETKLKKYPGYDISKHYFNPQRTTGETYGSKYSDDKLLWSMSPEIRTFFDPFSNCNSCQMIIAKTTRS